VTGAPESRRQAQRWEQNKRRWLAVLDCHPCAAQAAWAAQCGYSAVHPPCDSCRAKVAALPVPAVNGWRTGRPVGASEMTVTDVPVSPDSAEPRRSLTGEGRAA
jgi:hypothetical protein